MSKNKNKKKQRRRMSPETADRIRTGLGTLFNNDCCIKAAREWKGAWNFLPIFVALLAVSIGVVPTLVTNLNVRGEAYVFGDYSYGYETGLMDFTHALAKNGIEIEVGENAKIAFGGLDGLYTEFKDNNGTTRLHKWYADVNPLTGQPEFEVFFNEDALSYTDSQFFANIEANKDLETGETRSYDSAGEPVSIFQASYMAIGKESIRYRKRSHNSTGNALVGTYDRMKGFKFSSFVPRDNTGKEVGLDDLGNWTPSVAYADSVKQSYSKFMSDGFVDIKNGIAWRNVAIFAGIDLAVVALFSLLIFLMTRGKRNPFRIYSIWDTTKIACYASFTPGLISLVLGFLLSSYAILLFMFTFGMRIMWMTMKSLRPAQ